MRYNQQLIAIKVYIPTTDIDNTDKIKIYETTDNPSEGTLIATLKSVAVEVNPSTSAQSYLFQYSKRVSTPDNYKFEYSIIDKAGNESETINRMELDVCLIPRTPSPLSLNSTTATTIVLDL